MSSAPLASFALQMTDFACPHTQTGEITNLAGCDFLTISPSLLKDLQGSTEDLPRVLSPEKAGQAEPMEKVSFIDNEPAFRWSLVTDSMAQEKLHEGESPLFGVRGSDRCVLIPCSQRAGIVKFAADADELKSLLKAKIQ